jgi:hypothetical protein
MTQSLYNSSSFSIRYLEIFQKYKVPFHHRQKYFRIIPRHSRLAYILQEAWTQSTMHPWPKSGFPFWDLQFLSAHETLLLAPGIPAHNAGQ